MFKFTIPFLTDKPSSHPRATGMPYTEKYSFFVQLLIDGFAWIDIYLIISWDKHASLRHTVWLKFEWVKTKRADRHKSSIDNQFTNCFYWKQRKPATDLHFRTIMNIYNNYIIATYLHESIGGHPTMSFTDILAKYYNLCYFPFSTHTWRIKLTSTNIFNL